MASSDSENLAILITDMVGYTERSVSKSRADFQALMDRHNSVLKRTLKLYGGEWVKSTGDGMIALFRSPTNAVQCGMAMQDALAESNFRRPDEEQIQIRVSINVGEVRREGKNDVFGEAVNVAARIEALTPPSEVYFSQAVYLAMNKAEVPSECLGMHTVKGIPEPLEIFRVPSRQATRLVASGEKMDTEGVPYLFGGMRHAKPDSKIQAAISFSKRNASAVAAAVIALAVVLYVELNKPDGAPPTPRQVTTATAPQSQLQTTTAPPPRQATVSAPQAQQPATAVPQIASAPAAISQTQPAPGAPGIPAATPALPEAAASTESVPMPGSTAQPLETADVAAVPPQPESAPEPEPQAAEPEHYSLRVSAQPPDADIRILNIKPAYSPGMDLAAGRYHVEVSRSGYQTDERWITLDRDLSVQISLAEEPPAVTAPPPGEPVQTAPAVAVKTTNPLAGVKPYLIEDALRLGRERRVMDERVKFFFGDTPHGPVLRRFGEFRTSKKTNAFGKGDLETCQWAFLSALKALYGRALAVGGNAVINIRSNYGNQQTGNRDTFDCRAGAMMSGVALIGVVVKLE